jgi:hypothetical protein
MIEETITVLRGWDLGRSRGDNLRAMMETNSIGASSQSWLRDVAKVLHRRFEPGGRDRALVELAQGGVSASIFKPIMLWHMTRDELLVRDFITSWLFREYQRGTQQVRAADARPYLLGLAEEGRISAGWTRSTLERVANGLVRIAADFDLLEGRLARTFASYSLPDESLLYLLHALSETMPNAYDVVTSDDWKLFLMSASDVERALFRLHQFRRLHYETAGSLAQLSLPCDSALAYARELAS